MNSIDVSVVIPAYNRLWCLPKAIESCRDTRCRTEIIVVDDGSTDGNWEWLQKQTDIVCMRQANEGQESADNRASAIARGTYRRFLDSEDFLCAGYIERQFESAVANDADLVYSRVDDYFYPSGRIVEHSDPPLWDDFIAVQLGEGYGSHYLGMLFHHRLIDQTPRRPEIAMRDDRMLQLENGMFLLLFFVV